MDSFKLLFELSSTDKIVLCFSQFLLWNLSGTWLLLSLTCIWPTCIGHWEMQSMFLGKENFFVSDWLKGNGDFWFMTFIIFLYLDTSHCWGCFSFYSTSTFDLTVTLCNLRWPSGRPSKTSRFWTTWQNTLAKAQAVSSGHVFFPECKLLELENIYLNKSFRASFCDVILYWSYRTSECFWDALNYLGVGLNIHKKPQDLLLYILVYSEGFNQFSFSSHTVDKYLK